MSALERRYRLLLCAYPDEYLDHREEELIATLMATAQAGQRRPTAREALSLVRSGLEVRASLVGPSRRAAVREWVGSIAVGAIAMIVVMAVGIPLTRRFSEVSGWFLLLWTAIGATPAAFVAAPRVLRQVSMCSTAACLVGVVVGPEVMLVQRTLLVAVTLFLVLVMGAGGQRARHVLRVLSVPIGVAAGLVVSTQLTFKFDPHGQPEPLGWQAWKLNQVLHIDAPAKFWIPCLLVALAVSCVVQRGLVALVTAFLMIPTLLTIAVLTDQVDAVAAQGMPRVFALGVVAGALTIMAAGAGALASLRPGTSTSTS